MKKTLWFISPVLAFFIPPMLLLKASGENYLDLNSIIESKNNYLIGYAYNESNYKYLKYRELNSRDTQKIIALGSSRVLQFREEMFSSIFYNAGNTVSSISEFLPFLKSIPKEKYPKILIVNLDQWMFNMNWDPLTFKFHDSAKWEHSYKKAPSINTIIHVYSDLLKKKYGFKILEFKNESESLIKVGMNSIVNNTGFRNDGSFLYGGQILKLTNGDTTAIDYNFKDTFSRIDDGNRRFQYGKNINQKAIAELNELLGYCSENGIYVVGFLPPFADSVNYKLKKCGNYSYMDSIYKESSPLFCKYGFELWDMTNLEKYNSGNHEMIDGFHGSEVTYLRMLLFMVEHDSKLKDYCSQKDLSYKLQHKISDYVVYDN